MQVSTTTRAINSKRLFTEIDEIIKDGIYSIDISWSSEEDRGVFVEFLNSLLHEFWDNGSIEQWKIQCNNLNNTTEDMLSGMYILDIHYRQKHCLNTSKIQYTILE